MSMGILGQVDRVFDLESLAPHYWGFESCKWTMDSFMWGSFSAGLENVGGFTQGPACTWKNGWRGTFGLPPPVKDGKLPCDHNSVAVT